MVAPEIAIVDSNTLSCMGLQSLLEEIIPMAVIRVFSSFEELMDDTPDMYAHYFVSAQIYFEHTAFFLPRKPKTIVLANGDNQPQLAGIPTLNIYQDEKTLIRNILQLHQFGHKARASFLSPVWPASHWPRKTPALKPASYMILLPSKAAGIISVRKKLRRS